MTASNLAKPNLYIGVSATLNDRFYYYIGVSATLNDRFYYYIGISATLNDRFCYYIGVLALSFLQSLSVTKRSLSGAEMTASNLAKPNLYIGVSATLNDRFYYYIGVSASLNNQFQQIIFHIFFI